MKNSVLSFARTASLTVISVVVLLTVLVGGAKLLHQSPALAPVPVASVSYNTHPGVAIVAGAPALSVTESDNVAYLTWDDPGAVGVSSASVSISVDKSCGQAVNLFYRHATLSYPGAKNVDQGVSQPVMGRRNRGNAYWQFMPGNTYSAFITLTNAAGTSEPSSCVVFVAPQSDPEPAV